MQKKISQIPTNTVFTKHSRKSCRRNVRPTSRRSLTFTNTRKLPLIEERGQTDRVTDLANAGATDFQSPATWS